MTVEAVASVIGVIIGIVALMYIYGFYIDYKISSDVKSVLGSLTNIKFGNKTQQQVIQELKDNNFKYEIAEDGELWFGLKDNPNWGFSYDVFSFRVIAFGQNDYNKIKVTLERTIDLPISEQQIFATCHYIDNRVALSFLNKLISHGIHVIPANPTISF